MRKKGEDTPKCKAWQGQRAATAGSGQDATEALGTHGTQTTRSLPTGTGLGWGPLRDRHPA